MEPHADEVVTEGAGVDAVVEPLEPAPGPRIVLNLMLGSATFLLFCPAPEEDVLIDHVVLIFSPPADRLATGAVHLAETAQLAELLRELWDFR